jgi:hypothetical protein
MESRYSRPSSSNSRNRSASTSIPTLPLSDVTKNKGIPIDKKRAAAEKDILSSGSDSSSDSNRAPRSPESRSPDLSSARRTSGSSRQAFSSIFTTVTNGTRKLNRSTQTVTTPTIKQYYADTLLQERYALTHQYLCSFSADKLKKLYASAKATYESDSESGERIPVISNGISSAKNSSGKEEKIQTPVDIVPLKNDDNSIDYYLLDRSTVLGEGRDGTVFIAYKFPETIENQKEQQIYSCMMTSIAAVKLMNEYLDTNTVEDANIIKTYVKNLQANGLYLNHCFVMPGGCKLAKLCFFLHFINGPNAHQLFYRRDSGIHRDQPEHIINRNYLRPALKITIFREILTEYISSFYEKKIVPIDTKPENCMVVSNGSVSVKMIDTEKSISTETSLTCVTGTPGFIPFETLNKGSAYTQESGLCGLGLTLADLVTDKNYQKLIREMQGLKIDKNESTDSFVYQEISCMITDIFKDEFLSDTKNILNTLMQLPIQDVFEFLLPYLVNYSSEDIAFLKETPADIMNEIIYRLYFFPRLVKIILKLTQENPADRPQNKEELQTILHEIHEIETAFLPLSQNIYEIYNAIQNLPHKISMNMTLDFPKQPLLTRASIMPEQTVTHTNKMSFGC